MRLIWSGWINRNFIANIDITKPLQKWIRVRVCGLLVWLVIKYVKLSDFYLRVGC